MSKIVFLKTAILKRGGLEKYTLRLAHGFSKQGLDVTILTTDYQEGALGDVPFRVVSLGNKSSFSLYEIMRFDSACKKYVADSKPDVVFGLERNFCPQSHYRAGNGCHRAYLERRKKVDSWLKGLSFSINPLHQLILEMEKATFESPNLRCLFVNSHLVEEEICTFYPLVDPKKITVVHNGVEWKELEKPFTEGERLREHIMKAHGLHPHLHQFLFVGNEYGRKGLGLLLEALACLPKKTFQLTVVGKEKNPAPFMQKAKALGLEKDVIFVGPVSETKTYYSASDTLVIPSLYDPFANVTVEALAMGLRVVSSSSNGGSEVIANKRLGTIFSELQDPQELASALQDALSHPKTLESAATIRQAVSHLDFSNQIDKILQKTVLAL